MGVHKLSEWRKLPLSLTELCIDTTLRCGQSFRWRRINDEWHCVLHGRLVSLKQDASHLHYKVAWPKTTTTRLVSESKESDPVHDDTETILQSYFALSHSLSSLYTQWAASDANFARRATAFTGIRILNQDAWEALVAFICSSNNNISRISQMVHKLCLHYGPYVGTIEDEPFHDFPGPEALAGAQVEAHLRQLGFGYRAKYIAETARIVSAEKLAGWLLRLRNPACPAPYGSGSSPVPKPLDANGRRPAAPADAADPPATYRAAHDALLELAGVGPKVADCVCLMGLGWGEAVPVDTHVWQIAQRDYSFGKGTKSKTFTRAMYDAVGDHFRKIWGAQAGWAQSVLFTANLKSFAEQASAGRGSKREGVDGKVKVEVEESKIKMKAEVVGSTAEELDQRETAAVKVEESQGGVTAVAVVSRSRKRKIPASLQTVTGDGKVAAAARVEEAQVRRVSKRLRGAAS